MVIRTPYDKYHIYQGSASYTIQFTSSIFGLFNNEKMELIIPYHEPAAAFLARVFLGLLFFFQGYDAVFRVKIKNIIYAYERDFASHGIPKFMTVAGAWFTSYAELIGGILLVAGLLEYPALYLLCIDLIVASIAFGMNSPVWDTKFVLPRLLLLLFLLVIPPAWNVWSLDHLLSFY
jgi:putative oxidoreductase